MNTVAHLAVVVAILVAAIYAMRRPHPRHALGADFWPALMLAAAFLQAYMVAEYKSVMLDGLISTFLFALIGLMLLSKDRIRWFISIKTPGPNNVIAAKCADVSNCGWLYGAISRARALLHPYLGLCAASVIVCLLLLAIRYNEQAVVFAPSAARVSVTRVGLAFVLSGSRQSRITIIDVRSKKDYDLRHIRSATDFYSAMSGAIDKNRNIVMYCRDMLCGAAFAEAKKLAVAIQRPVFVYEGGLREWIDCGLPTDGTSN